MARPRKKKRTHLGASNGQTHNTPSKRGNSVPKSMVIRIGAGEVGPSISQLVKDVREMMEPGTARRLKERRSNKLRDYTAMAGPLGVSHLLLFSRSESGNTNLRIALAPRGPTLNFRVEKYSLAKDVKNAQKRPQGRPKDYLTSPLLVMNNFNSPATGDASKNAVPKHLESLTTTMFQSLFPPISPQNTPLSSIRRVLLLNRELSTSRPHGEDNVYIITLRHYAIVTKPAELSRGVRRLNMAEKLLNRPKKQKKNVPDLGKLEDVADYLLDPSAAVSGFTSASESEVDTDAEVEVVHRNTKKVLNQQQMAHRRARDRAISETGKIGTEKRAVKLVELGPRLKLRMTKVEEGLCAGKVMWHEYIHKTEEEKKDMERTWDKRRKEKNERKRVQKENVEKKRKEKRAKSSGGKADGASTDHSDAAIDDDMDDHEWDSDTEEDLVGDNPSGDSAEAQGR